MLHHLYWLLTWARFHLVLPIYFQKINRWCGHYTRAAIQMILRGMLFALKLQSCTFGLVIMTGRYRPPFTSKLNRFFILYIYYKFVERFRYHTFQMLSRAPFTLKWINLIHTWISNHMSSEMWHRLLIHFETPIVKPNGIVISSHTLSLFTDIFIAIWSLCHNALIAVNQDSEM